MDLACVYVCQCVMSVCLCACLKRERERVCTAFSGHSPGTKADCEETGKKNHVTLACFKNNTEEQKIILLTLLCEYRLENLCFIYDQISKLQKDVQITKHLMHVSVCVLLKFRGFHCWEVT